MKDKERITEDRQFGIDSLTPPETVDYFIYRLETGRWRKAAKAWMIAAFVEFITIIFIILGILWYESQFEDVEVSQEVTQTTDQGGSNSNTLYTGDYYGNADSKNDDQKKDP